MPAILLWIGGALGTVFTGIFSGLLTYFGKKYAIILAAITFAIVITTAMMTAIYSLMASIALVIPPSLPIAASWVVPDNAQLVISIYLAARVIRWGYDMNILLIQMKVA